MTQPNYEAAWKELNRVLPPSRTQGLPHDCDIEDHEDEVDLLDCIGERFGVSS